MVERIRLVDKQVLDDTAALTHDMGTDARRRACSFGAAYPWACSGSDVRWFSINRGLGKETVE